MPGMNTSFRYLTVSSAIHDEESRSSVPAFWKTLLEAAGGIPAGEADLGESSPLVYFVLTGGTEQEILRLRSMRNRLFPGEPVLLLAHPLHNSLPAALEILARLQQDRQAGRIVFLDDSSLDTTKRDLAEAVRCLVTASFLRSARIGVVGHPSDWLVASSHLPSVVAEQWGPTLVEIPMGHFREALGRAGGDPVSLPAGRGARASVEPTPEDLGRSTMIYRALRELVAAHNLDALTLRCFDLVLQDRATGCLALAQLNDDGVTAGCEGDIPSVLGLLWARLLTGRPGWMANPARVDAGQGRLVLAHCTVPISLVTGYTLRSHFESGLGAAVQGDLAPGEVTLLRIGGRDLDQLWLGEGVIEPAAPREGLCRTQVTVRGDPDWIGRLLERPLGNHVLLLPGRWRRPLEISRTLMARP